MLRGVSAVQLGKVLAKISRCDSRIATKTVHNVKMYFMPPTCGHTFYHNVDDADFLA